MLLCSPHRACQSCLSDAWCIFLLPSRAYAIRVCPTLGCSLSWIPHLGRRNATRCEAVSNLCRCFWHSCLLSSVLAAPHRTCPRASAICVCTKSHARCPSTSIVLLFPSLPCAPYTTFPSSIHVCATLGDPHKLLPWPSPHAYATRACPTLGWPLSSYKPGSPRTLTCSPLRACQSCLPGAWCVFLLPSPACALCIHPTSYSCRPNFTLTLRSPRVAATRAYRLLALSSAPFLYSLHRLVSQSTRNMVDWLKFLFPCAFLYTTDSIVACGVRVCKLLPCSNLSLPFPFATCLRHACLLYPRPAFVFLQALHSPRATLQPSWRVPTVSVRRLVRLSLAFTRFCHSCLPETWLLFVLDSPPWADKCHTQGVRLCPAVQVLLALMSALLGTCNPRRSCPACLPATYYILLLPFMRVVQHLVRLSLAFARLCHSCLPDTRLLFVLASPPWPDKRHKV